MPHLGGSQCLSCAFLTTISRELHISACPALPELPFSAALTGSIAGDVRLTHLSIAPVSLGFTDIGGELHLEQLPLLADDLAGSASVSRIGSLRLIALNSVASFSGLNAVRLFLSLFLSLSRRFVSLRSTLLLLFRGSMR